MSHQHGGSRAPSTFPEPLSYAAMLATPSVEVVVVTEGDQRVAYVQPATSGKGRRRRLGTHAGMVVSDLQRLAAEAQLLEGKTRAAVHHARDLGVSWALIGFSTGLAESGARKRFGEPDEGCPIHGEATDL